MTVLLLSFQSLDIFPSRLNEPTSRDGGHPFLSLELKENDKRFPFCMFLFWVALPDLPGSIYQII